MEIVGTFLKYNDEFVILHRQSHKPEGGSWGLPAGKVETREDHRMAAKRELLEETGYNADVNALKHLGDFEFGEGDRRYTFVAYELTLSAKHQVILEDSAHDEARYINPIDCFRMENLIADFRELLELVGYAVISNTE